MTWAKIKVIVILTSQLLKVSLSGKFLQRDSLVAFSGGPGAKNDITINALMHTTVNPTCSQLRNFEVSAGAHNTYSPPRIPARTAIPRKYIWVDNTM